MKASWINQKNIDREKWDKLVSQSEFSSIYVCSFYLDATAIDWEAYIAEDYSFAIPVGVVKKGGFTRVYPPLFQHFIEPIGDTTLINWQEFETSITQRFKKGDIHFKNDVLPNIKVDPYVYQTLSPADFKLKSQAKRTLKKFENSSLVLKESNIDTEELINLIIDELSKKVAVFASKEVEKLKKLVEIADKKGIVYKVAVIQEGVLSGGLIGLKHNNRMLYLKGTATDKAQNEGAMYALMNKFIENAFSQQLIVDFGGSRVPSIRFFFQRFSAKDQYYYNYSWDQSPLWFRWGYKLYSLLKRRS